MHSESEIAVAVWRESSPPLSNITSLSLSLRCVMGSRCFFPTFQRKNIVEEYVFTRFGFFLSRFTFSGGAYSHRGAQGQQSLQLQWPDSFATRKICRTQFSIPISLFDGEQTRTGAPRSSESQP